MNTLVLMRNPNKPNEVIDPMDFVMVQINWHKQAMEKALKADNMEKLHHHHIQLNQMQIRLIAIERSFRTHLN